MLNLFPGDDTYSYRGWLVSDHFWKRAFAVFGYGLAAEAAIFLAILLVMGVLAAMGIGLALVLPE